MTVTVFLTTRHCVPIFLFKTTRCSDKHSHQSNRVLGTGQLVTFGSPQKTLTKTNKRLRKTQKTERTRRLPKKEEVEDVDENRRDHWMIRREKPKNGRAPDDEKRMRESGKATRCMGGALGRRGVCVCMCPAI